jgi:hypothetical protein
MKVGLDKFTESVDKPNKGFDQLGPVIGWTVQWLCSR